LDISDKGPVKYCDRASQHSLHGARSHALSHFGPENSHRLGTAHVTIDDWGLKFWVGGLNFTERQPSERESEKVNFGLRSVVRRGRGERQSCHEKFRF
jgi:hypothetical protein